MVLLWLGWYLSGPACQTFDYWDASDEEIEDVLRTAGGVVSLMAAAASVDLRILKSIFVSPQKHLDLVVESFNLLNHTNVTLINPYFGAGLTPLPGFGRPTEALNARQIQFSIDFEY